jgi:hypothetical protein
MLINFDSLRSYLTQLKFYQTIRLHILLVVTVVRTSDPVATYLTRDRVFRWDISGEETLGSITNTEHFNQLSN